MVKKQHRHPIILEADNAELRELLTQLYEIIEREHTVDGVFRIDDIEHEAVKDAYPWVAGSGRCSPPEPLEGDPDVCPYCGEIEGCSECIRWTKEERRLGGF